MKLIVLIDQKLKTQEKKLIDTHFNSYEITPIDYDKHFDELPKVDCYIVSSRAYWWDWNLMSLKEQKVVSVYYSKGILDEPFKLHTDYVITRFPKLAKNKDDLVSRLCYNSLPKPPSRCGLCCGFCLSKITMKSLISKMCGCFQCCL
jgi:hypothetical protein